MRLKFTDKRTFMFQFEIEEFTPQQVETLDLILQNEGADYNELKDLPNHYLLSPKESFYVDSYTEWVDKLHSIIRCFVEEVNDTYRTDHNQSVQRSKLRH